MKSKKWLPGIAVAAVSLGLVLAGLSGQAGAAEPVDIPTILPLTGPASFLGKASQANLAALEEVVNADGGIAGRPVRFPVSDDQSSPQQDVQIANGILAGKPPIILGSSVVALCNAMAPLMRNGPVMYCLSPSFAPAVGGFTFSSGSATRDQISAIVRYMRLRGATKLALLNSTDATGQNADKDIKLVLAKPENATLQIVEQQHFNPSDVTVAAQIERIKDSGAQAMIAWTTGVPVATVFKGMIQAGLDIPIGISSGNQTFAQMAQFTGFLPRQLLIGSSLFPPHDGIMTLEPQVEAAQKAMNAALATHGLQADIATAVDWDAGLITVAALRKLGAGATAAQVRDFIAGLTDFPGVDGVYDFKRFPDRGLGPDSVTVVSYDAEAKRWKWLSQPGGAPLP
jgi:branched-chain amino acid transport system substrate-binding protein